ncbi:MULTISPECIES: tripartite tricarboxylate transporter TctB family protein [unclassified Halomonas]|uniref:tripartite tricarboxylate transporter TctB family protein n=1 Tax=unclassified Halomonas TaxID=2609666 RepID=UPI004033519B
MTYQTLKYRLKTIEFWTLLLLLLVGGYFFIQAFDMPFEMRRTIGPGFIPTIVLFGLISCTLVALTQFLTNKNYKIFTNFPEGSEDDTTFKALTEALNTQAGTHFALSSHTGLGRFSALSVIKQSHPDTSLLAASSRATQVNAELAAQEHLSGFTPLSLLYFDAFILAARTGTNTSTNMFAQLKIGYDSLIEDTVFLEKLRQRSDIQVLPNEQWQAMDIKALRDALSKGKIDIILAARSELSELLQNGELTILEAFDGKTLGKSELIYGEWAALFVPDNQAIDIRQQNAERLEAAIYAPPFTAQLQHVQVPWQFTAADQAKALLGALATQGTQGVAVKAQPARGRAYAIPITLLAIALFPFLMNIVGFIATSILITSLIMALLRAELSLVGLAKIGVINVGIAVSTYMVFYHIFSIPLPLGSIW